MTDRSGEYQSYLLRLWRARHGERGVWRASLEDARTGQRHSFVSLSAAFRFLDVQTADALDEHEQEGAGHRDDEDDADGSDATRPI